MAAVTTTLPLFWHLSSANKDTRIDASVKLVSALQQFQDKFAAEEESSSADRQDEDEDDGENEKDEQYSAYSSRLDASNAADVAYAIRRLLRGLASPRESSRLGFAVALTELLSRIDTVSCQQILVLLSNASQTVGGMSGQEERDMLFARLFGLESIIQSGLLFRQKPLRSSSTSSGSLKAFEVFLTELLVLGEKKTWLRESCWWTLMSAVDALYASDVQWKEEAFNTLFTRVFVDDRSWGPEKIALTLKLQKTHPDVNWQAFCSSYFKSSDILSTTNLVSLGRILKDSIQDGATEDEISKRSVGLWKPQLHFVWDGIFDTMLAPEGPSVSSGNFQDFYRIVVDETLFSSSSSPQRKYWGFQVFQSALRRLSPAKLSLLFTKNFMRTWINQLSKSDRYLHKIARQLASDVQEIVEKDPKVGFTLVLQLTGTNGSFHFDRITKTKTVETIFASMDSNGIKEYIEYLLKHVNEGKENDSFTSIGARRAWIVDQMTALVRKGSIPKNDETIRLVLDWLTTHAFFTVAKKTSKSTNFALRTVPDPPFSEELHEICRTKLLACLADLTSISTAVETKDDAKVVKDAGVTVDGEYWISKVFKTIAELEKDTKHVAKLRELDGKLRRLWNDALMAMDKIKASAGGGESARGTGLLLSALLLKCLCDDEEEANWEALRDCIDASSRLFAPIQNGREKKKQGNDDDGDRAPIDLIVDIIIGLLEQSTSFTRLIANQSFSLLTATVTDSTVDLILTQLERRDPIQEDMDEDEDIEMDDDEESDDKEDDQGSESAGDDNDKEEDVEDTEELRKALQAAISGKKIETDNDCSGGSSDDEASMDDEQMMQIDEKLAAVFRTRAEERKTGKDVGAQREATYFKNRVLDLVDTFMKKQPSSTLVFRFVLPLIELVSTASTDEMQLSDKAKGILRARLRKTKEAPGVTDVPKTVELLESLHQRARKAHTSEIVATISLCSLFITRVLLAANEQAPVRIYKESIADFVTRKASALNPPFVLDFIRRFPLHAWSILASVVEVTGSATNGYRQSQAFNIIQVIFTSLPQPDSKKDKILAFMPLVSKAFVEAVSSSCTSDKPLMTAAQMKDTLRVALQLCRFSKRFANDTAVLSAAWPPREWSGVGTALSLSEHFKVSTSLAKTCQQISQFAQSTSSSKSKSAKAPAKSPPAQTKSSLKRKQEAEGEGADEIVIARTKPKRKKVRKHPK